MFLPALCYAELRGSHFAQDFSTYTLTRHPALQDVDLRVEECNQMQMSTILTTKLVCSFDFEVFRDSEVSDILMICSTLFC